MNGIVVWLRGLLLRRPGRLLGTAAGIALTVALLTALNAFLAASAATMTARAIADVPVDWQIALVPGTDPATVTAALDKATGYTALASVAYADTPGLQATAGGTVQTTGAGKVLGLPPGYAAQFPAQIRPLIGATDGVLIAQQTASNLHVAPGDTVTIGRVGLPDATVQIAGVVDLPNADSLFQAVGVPAGSAPQAPPDNVVLVPAATWHTLFDAQGAARPDSVRLQLHVRIRHDLPADPGTAYVTVQARAHNLEARIAGSGVVGDNLGARLLGVQADALYARVLFLFLGVPGAILAALVTLAVAGVGADRRRGEQALLRTRGASTGAILRLASVEAGVAGVLGVLGGLVLAAGALALILPGGVPLDAVAGGVAVAALAGLVLALGAVLVPVWREARQMTVRSGWAVVGRPGRPLWQRLYLDVIVLGVAGIVFWQTASTGYQVVVAPEGVPQSAVAYQVFLAPVGLWLGVGLLLYRLGSGVLARGRRSVTALLRLVAANLAGIVAAALGRRRLPVTRGLVLVALAFAFATSTAVFNTTYNAQARVDAELTNGADVSVIGSAAHPAGPQLAAVAGLPGVAGSATMQHRFAYVGNDLQDLYGIDPQHLATATPLSNAFFANGDARATMAALAAQPDGILVSAETVHDYQLTPGDSLNLRLQNASDHQYHVVPFHFIGVAREFPTAPHDAFLITNATYVAQQTGAPDAEIVLLRAAGDPAALAAQVRRVLGATTGLRVTEIGETSRLIGSSLTAVDLSGLTALELTFAVLLVAAATGLVLALGLAERRRTFAILGALGARPAQIGAFLWSEGLWIAVGGAIAGLALGFAVAQMLVTVLTGVFDPPPEQLAVPWPYLALLLGAAAVTTAVAVLGARRAAYRAAVDALHEI